MLPRLQGMPKATMSANTNASYSYSLRRTRAIAGPNPFHSAFTPSVAIVFRAQSMIPEYVPVGADCNLDFKT